MFYIVITLYYVKLFYILSVVCSTLSLSAGLFAAGNSPPDNELHSPHLLLLNNYNHSTLTPVTRHHKSHSYTYITYLNSLGLHPRCTALFRCLRKLPPPPFFSLILTRASRLLHLHLPLLLLLSLHQLSRHTHPSQVHHNSTGLTRASLFKSCSTLRPSCQKPGLLLASGSPPTSNGNSQNPTSCSLTLNPASMLSSIKARPPWLFA